LWLRWCCRRGYLYGFQGFFLGTPRPAVPPRPYREAHITLFSAAWVVLFYGFFIWLISF
jgi:hypothetical protein